MQHQLTERTMSESSSSSSRGVELADTPSQVPRQKLQDSENDESSTASSYEYESSNDLNMQQGAALLTADCLGTGLLALPQDVKVLGTIVGIGFLILNLVINLYAGTILARAADHVEDEQERKELMQQDHHVNGEEQLPVSITAVHRDGILRVVRPSYSSVASSDTQLTASTTTTLPRPLEVDTFDDEQTDFTETRERAASPAEHEDDTLHHEPHHAQHDSATSDFIGMTQELFPHGKAIGIVTCVYYANIFLVLGDYILVMAHAVAAMIGEDRLCLPTAGILACTLMFAVSQLRTMANLGRSASIVSLTALAIVIVFCLVGHHNAPAYQNAASTENVTLLRQFSSIASIGFAVGSQKLFLNIRHEMKHRQESPRSLGISLSLFGSVYVAICLLAGSNPPSFLFDAIPSGWNRRLAGFLLWVHVAVSYAINSQAICSSMDRLFAHRWDTCWNLRQHAQRRWLILTLVMTVSSYLVANAVPFFKDLVALIGALTSVPLTLLLPAIMHRRVINVPLWLPTRESMASYSLLLYGIIFLIAGLTGALGSIELDWSGHGPPFSCR